jgi:hypothetical protein
MALMQQADGGIPSVPGSCRFESLLCWQRQQLQQM